MGCDFLLHFDYIFLFYFAKTEGAERAGASVLHGRDLQSGRGVLAEGRMAWAQKNRREAERQGGTVAQNWCVLHIGWAAHTKGKKPYRQPYSRTSIFTSTSGQRLVTG